MAMVALILCIKDNERNIPWIPNHWQIDWSFRSWNDWNAWAAQWRWTTIFLPVPRTAVRLPCNYMLIFWRSDYLVEFHREKLCVRPLMIVLDHVLWVILVGVVDNWFIYHGLYHGKIAMRVCSFPCSAITTEMNNDLFTSAHPRPCGFHAMICWYSGVETFSWSFAGNSFVFDHW